MIPAWRIAADTLDYLADDRTGAGAKKEGGRWNQVGTALLYLAETQALACLETFIHLRTAGLPLNRYLVQFDIPDDVWKRRTTLTAATAPVGWDAIPTGQVSVNYGTAWAKGNSAAVVVVPSVIIPDELNILINPNHPDASKIKHTKLRRWTYDPRLFGDPTGVPTTRLRRWAYNPRVFGKPLGTP